MHLPALDKNSTQDEIENAIRSMSVGDYLQLTGDRGSFISTEYSPDNDHFLNLNEVSLSGKEEMIYVDGRVKSPQDIVRAFLMYKNNDSGLAGAFDWKAPEPFVSDSLFIDLPSDSSDEEIDESLSKLYAHICKTPDEAILQGGRGNFIQCISDIDQYLVILQEMTQHGVVETSALVKPSDKTSITQAFLHFRHGDPELWNDLGWFVGPDGKETDVVRNEIQKAVASQLALDDAIYEGELEVVDKNPYLPASHTVGEYGEVSPKMICPHCATTGMVHTKRTKKKVGISGAKATGVFLTLGWSILATGLSRKEMTTAAYCANCEAEWEL